MRILMWIGVDGGGCFRSHTHSNHNHPPGFPHHIPTHAPTLVLLTRPTHTLTPALRACWTQPMEMTMTHAMTTRTTAPTAATLGSTGTAALGSLTNLLSGINTAVDTSTAVLDTLHAKADVIRYEAQMQAASDKASAKDRVMIRAATRTAEMNAEVKSRCDSDKSFATLYRAAIKRQQEVLKDF